MTVQCSVGAENGTLLARLTGDLIQVDVADLCLRLLKCLAEQPDALVLELSGLVVTEPLALAVLTSVARQAARWPGTPVLLCAPSAHTRTLLLAPAHHRLPVFDTVAAALRHAGRTAHSLPTITDELLPIAGAARQARNVATDACLTWDLPHLVAPASLIASELVSNVVEHADTMMTIRVSLRRRYLNIAVRDGSPREPVARTLLEVSASGGRGLMLIAATAVSWGFLPTEGGKVVWAALAR